VFGDAPNMLRPGAIGYVPQIEEVDFSFPVSVRDVVSMGRYPRLGPFAPFRAADRRATGYSSPPAMRYRVPAMNSGGR